MSTYNQTLVYRTPGKAHHHPQSTSVARPLQSGAKYMGQYLLIATALFVGYNWNDLSSPVSGLFESSNTEAHSAIAASDWSRRAINVVQEDGSLFLMEKASLFVSDTEAFEGKVVEISSMLGIAPEWLMAVMYSESKFDASVENLKGSGATGLIQFMDGTAQEMNISLERLARMNHLQQLEYVYLYLQTVRERYGDYQDLTDLYLAVLYPKARGQRNGYTLYAKPSKQYAQNSGLDENKDGRVTVGDIEQRMMRLYPTAFQAQPSFF
ncbi:MAG: transglycosylase SLT domain-containing protein [Bacteroidia bacterium]|nr:transglycosylase SLT domain-containing protein [Bacteroidia bacterium]